MGKVEKSDEEKALPAPEKELELPAPEHELDLPAPEEKLLPAPTFWQQYGKVLKYVFLCFVLIICFSSGGYLIANKQSLIPVPEATVTPTDALDQVMCSQEAKLCPDGSYVARSGPKCEFKACPAATAIVLPTEDPSLTASWSTYTNQKGGYLFKYPKNYQLNVGKSNGVDGVESKSSNVTSLLSPAIFVDTHDSNQGKTNFQMQISFIQNSQNYTLEILPEKTGNCSYFDDHKGKHILIGTIDALWFEDTPCGPRGLSILFVTHGNLIYQIIFESSAPYKDFKSVSDQILSTFKFTDQTAGSPTLAVTTPPPGCYYKVCNKMCTRDNPNCCQTPDNLVCPIETPTAIPPTN